MKLLQRGFIDVRSAGGETSTWTAYVGKVLSAASSYFPAQVSDMMSQDRAFATVHLPKTNQRNVCALAMWVLAGPSVGEPPSLPASEWVNNYQI